MKPQEPQFKDTQTDTRTKAQLLNDIREVVDQIEFNKGEVLKLLDIIDGLEKKYFELSDNLKK